jgi:hypothetical protein
MKGRIKRYEDGGEIEVERSSGIEEILGSLSPVYGMATGKGMFGKDVGLLPMAARSMRKKMREKDGEPVSVSIEIEKSGEMEEPIGMNRGGRMGYGEGGSLKMVDKNGSKVPFFAADGKGKMMGGGMTYGKGGMTRGNRDGCAIKGKTKGRFV